MVTMENSEGFDVVSTIAAPKLVYNTPGTTYTVVAAPEDGGGRLSLSSNVVSVADSEGLSSVTLTTQSHDLVAIIMLVLSMLLKE